MVPGLFLALVAAFLVLAANNHWLFPALDRTGALYLTTAPQIAQGAPPGIPVGAWDAVEPMIDLEGQGTLMPLVMAGVVRTGARPHVAGLWLMAAGLGVTVFALAWAVGGVGGMAGAVAVGVLVLASPLTRDAATVLGPDTLLAALVALLAGAMTYQPRWALLHGALGALAWLAHPAGVGALAAAAVWAGARTGSRGRRLGRMAAALAPAAALLAVGGAFPLLLPPHVTGGSGSPWAAPAALIRWAALGHGGAAGVTAGLVVLAAGGVLVVVEALSTPEPPSQVHWSDPAAPDVLARSFRPATALLALGTLLGAMWAGRAGVLDRPWLPSAVLLSALAAAAAVRWARRSGGVMRWTPVLLLGLWAGLAGWSSWEGLARLREEGRGLTAAVWVASPVTRWIDNRARTWPVLYASDPVLVYVQTGRRTRGLPEPGAPVDAFVSAWRASPGPLVVTGDAPEAWIEGLRERLDVVEEVRVPEGRILVPAHGSPGAPAAAPPGRGAPQPETGDASGRPTADRQAA